MTKRKTFSIFSCICHLIDHLEKRLSVNKHGTHKQYKTTNKLNIFFTNKEVKNINLPKILRSRNVLSKMSSDTSKCDVPVVTYK